MDGILNIRKPAGPTSHDVVARVRRLARTRRVGHAGTLDPLAEGVLVLFLGAATRLIEFTVGADKEYVAEAAFGISTTTLDAEGEITQTADASDLTGAQALAMLPRFTGEIQQVPPMYSAVHHQGRRLYELARQGREVERPSRTVTVYELEMLRFVPGPEARACLRVACSKGVYVRSLCADLGRALGLPAHLAHLRRTRVGTFRIENALDLEAFAGQEPLWDQLLIPMGAAVAHLPCIQVTAESLVRVRHGNPVPVPPPDGERPERVRIVTESGELVGVGRREQAGGAWRMQPQKILHPSGRSQ